MQVKGGTSNSPNEVLTNNGYSLYGMQFSPNERINNFISMPSNPKRKL